MITTTAVALVVGSPASGAPAFGAFESFSVAEVGHDLTAVPLRYDGVKHHDCQLDN